MTSSEKPEKKEFNLNFSRKKRAEKISQLTDYRKQYDVNSFIKDLVVYFDGEVDFNLDKIRQEIEESQHLGNLIKKANQNNTHPVTEFIQELFEDVGQSGDIEWSGEW